MNIMKLTKEETAALVDWFEKNHRDLPWRDTDNPYDTWISEIMLQQTRVEASVTASSHSRRNCRI